MGQITPHEALALRWAELCNDPRLRDLPGKIELNAYGVIEMSPDSNRHGINQVAIARARSRATASPSSITASA